MAVLDILRYPDQRLHTVARRVEHVDDRIRKLVSDMAQTMYDAPGVGLAATQVNVHERVIVIDVSETKDRLQVFINPEIVSYGDERSVHEEGCLSVPGIYDEVERPEQVTVRALDEHGKSFTLSADGLLAVCIQHEMDHLLGKVFVQYFGLGEVTGNITVLPPALHDPEDHEFTKIGTCGFERTGMQVAIMDDHGKELQPFETGEICAIGPAVFAGYYNNPEANAKAFRDGWFRTGDLGHMDEQGFVYITGRASDMYISGGSNIYPREVEEKILTHPAIAEVAVLGVPDKLWGEVGVAVCVVREGHRVTEREVAEYLSPKVPRYKMPKRFFFWEALPKSGYGKVPKRMVKDELEARGLVGPDGLI